MLIYAMNPEEGVHVLVEDDKAAARALKVLRVMRWAHVKRHGRRGQRWYTITMRNPAEHKMTSIEVDGAIVRLVPPRRGV